MILLEQIVMQIFLWILQMVDGLVDIFSTISGISNVRFNQEHVNILETFLGDSTITAVFWAIFLLAIGLGLIFTTIAIIKNMIANNKNITSIIGKFFLFLLGSLAVLAVIYIGILIANAVLQLLAEMLNFSGASMSNAFFNACVGGHYTKNWNLESMLAAEGVDRVTELSVEKIMGGHHNWAIFAGNDDWKNNGYIEAARFSYLPALVGSGILLFKILVMALHLAQRLFDIVFLYLTMPASISTLPMDDGARFKNWRETFVTKIIIVYGGLIALSLFVMMTDVFSQMSIENMDWFGNSIFYIVMIVGGAFMIQGSIELFAKIFGSGEDMSQSKHLVGRGFGLLAHGAIHVAGAAWAKTGGKAANKLGGLAWEKTVGSFRNTHDRAKDSAKHNIATAKYQQRIESRSEVKAANQRKAEATKGIQQEFQSNIKNFQRESEMDRPGIYQTGGNEAEHTTSLPSGNTATSSSTTENHSMSVPGLPGMEGRDGKDGQKGDRGERGFRGFEGKPGAPGINSSDSNSTDGGNKK